jgi:hypothetical protein
MIEIFKNEIFKCASSFDIVFFILAIFNGDESNKIMQMKPTIKVSK